MANHVAYTRSKQQQLAGLPMKPSGPISDPAWIALLNDTAQYAPQVRAAGLGELGWGGHAFHSITHAIAQVASVPLQAVAPIVVKPLSAIVAVTGSAISTITAPVVKVLSPVAHVGKAVVGVGRGFVGKVIPGVAPKPDTPSAWPAQLPDGRVVDQAGYNTYITNEVQVNPYTKKPISAAEYQQWLDASNNNWWVPVSWSVGQPAPTQDMINSMKTASYADGYRPSTQAEFSAYVAAVDAGNAAAGASSPTTISQVTSNSTTAATVSAPVAPMTSATVLLPSSGARALTIDQAAALAASNAVAVPTTDASALQAPAAQPLTVAAAAATSGTQTDPPASTGAPVGLIAAIGAAAFFLFKK